MKTPPTSDNVVDFPNPGPTVDLDIFGKMKFVQLIATGVPRWEAVCYVWPDRFPRNTNSRFNGKAEAEAARLVLEDKFVTLYLDICRKKLRELMGEELLAMHALRVLCMTGTSKEVRVAASEFVESMARRMFERSIGG